MYYRLDLRAAASAERKSQFLRKTLISPINQKVTTSLWREIFLKTCIALSGNNIEHDLTTKLSKRGFSLKAIYLAKRKVMER